jgi:hypothetical protein
LWLLPPKRAIDFVATVRLEHEHRLNTYRHEQEDFAVHGLPIDDPTSPRFFAYATLVAGMSYENHMIAWCDWLTENIDRITQHGDKPASL